MFWKLESWDTIIAAPNSCHEISLVLLFTVTGKWNSMSPKFIHVESYFILTTKRNIICCLETAHRSLYLTNQEAKRNDMTCIHLLSGLMWKCSWGEENPRLEHQTAFPGFLTQCLISVVRNILLMVELEQCALRHSYTGSFFREIHSSRTTLGCISVFIQLLWLLSLVFLRKMFFFPIQIILFWVSLLYQCFLITCSLQWFKLMVEKKSTN